MLSLYKYPQTHMQCIAYMVLVPHQHSMGDVTNLTPATFTSHGTSQYPF